jgi:two-component system alkaline phosphatase synthesis response regulator PhoP
MLTPLSVLIVDDNFEKEEYSKPYFPKDKFVLNFSTPELAINRVGSLNPKIVILKLVYQGSIEGVEICNSIRNNLGQQDTFIFFFSERVENYSKIAALNAGADYFFSVPLSKSLFQAQINSILRRYFLAGLNQKGSTKKKIVIDYERYLVLKNDDELILPKKEFEILSLLVSQPKKVFSRDEIKWEVWKKEPDEVRNRTIDVHIRKLREKIGENYIQTIKGVGYKYEVKK